MSMCCLFGVDVFDVVADVIDVAAAMIPGLSRRATGGAPFMRSRHLKLGEDPIHLFESRDSEEWDSEEGRSGVSAKPPCAGAAPAGGAQCPRPSNLASC